MGSANIVVGIDLTDLAVGAGRGHPITACRAGWATHEVITLIGREDEQRVARVDAIVGQAREERVEGSIRGCQRRNVASLSWSISWSIGMCVVGVGDIGVGDRHPVFLHSGYIGKRDGGRHAIKAGEADVRGIGSILDDKSVQVRQWQARADLRGDVLVAVESLVPRIPTRLIGQQVRLPSIGAGAQRVSIGTVDANADEVSERLPWIGLHFLCLQRASPKDGGNIGRTILQNGIGRGNSAEVAACARERHPGCSCRSD